MRLDKLTTKFQQALADAQSLALGSDNGFIEPQHVLAALLSQEDGGTEALLQRAGVNVPPLKSALGKAISRLPKVEGQGGEITISRDLNNLFNLTDKEATKRGDQFIASELFLLVLADDKGETGRLAPQLLHRLLAGRRQLAPRPALLQLSSAQRVGKQHRDGHRADAARHRGDPACALLCTREVDIAAKLALRVAIDADVDHDRAGLHRGGAEQPRHADGGDEDVGASADRVDDPRPLICRYERIDVQ